MFEIENNIKTIFIQCSYGLHRLNKYAIIEIVNLVGTRVDGGEHEFIVKESDYNKIPHEKEEWVKFINNLSLKMAKVLGIHTDKNHADLSNSN